MFESSLPRGGIVRKEEEKIDFMEATRREKPNRYRGEGDWRRISENPQGW